MFVRPSTIDTDCLSVCEARLVEWPEAAIAIAVIAAIVVLFIVIANRRY